MESVLEYAMDDITDADIAYEEEIYRELFENEEPTDFYEADFADSSLSDVQSKPVNETEPRPSVNDHQPSMPLNYEPIFRENLTR